MDESDAAVELAVVVVDAAVAAGTGDSGRVAVAAWNMVARHESFYLLVDQVEEVECGKELESVQS